MKEELKTPLMVILAVIAVAAIAFYGFRTIGGAGGLDRGQIEYTPGVPPWMEESKAQQPAGGPPTGAPAIGMGPE